MTRTRTARNDDIDLIVDTILEDPRRAEDMKRMLRRRLAGEDAVHVVPRPAAPRRVVEPEDLWDNVPV